jgi:hypothetical protein
LSGSAAAAVLHVCVVCFYKGFEMKYGLLVIGFDEQGLAFPLHHLGLVKHQRVVDLLQIKLGFVVIQNGDVGSDEGNLVINKPFAKGSEVLVTVPFCEVGILQFLLWLDVEGTPNCVEVFEDLEGGDVAVGGVPVPELRVELLIDCIV